MGLVGLGLQISTIGREISDFTDSDTLSGILFKYVQFASYSGSRSHFLLSFLDPKTSTSLLKSLEWPFFFLPFILFVCLRNGQGSRFYPLQPPALLLLELVSVALLQPSLVLSVYSLAFYWSISSLRKLVLIKCFIAANCFTIATFCHFALSSGIMSKIFCLLTVPTYWSYGLLNISHILHSRTVIHH